jgi:hypothetical protein
VIKNRTQGGGFLSFFKEQDRQDEQDIRNVFLIPSSCGLLIESRGWSSCTYTLTDFVYEKALEILNMPKKCAVLSA